MRAHHFVSLFATAMLILVPMAVAAQVYNPPYWPPAPADEGPAHPMIPAHDVIVHDYQTGHLSNDDMRRMGLSVFATPFNTYDGLGDGPFDSDETDTRMPGQRPTLQGQRLSLRINGLDSQSCNECHTIVSNRSRLPTLGFAGVGGIVQNAIIMPTAADVADSMDDRMIWMPGHEPDLPMRFDGVADYSGRYANPPFLYGGGGVELLGKEMTRDLQAILRRAQSEVSAERIFHLETHGVEFGYLVSMGGGHVDFSHVQGVDHDLVVKPFGRKGEFFSMRDFDNGAMQFHFGVQPVEVVGPGVDGDGDGVTDEVTIGEMTVLHFFDVSNPPPRFAVFTSAEVAEGLRTTKTLGCTDCHRPQLTTAARSVPLSYPQVPENPDANVYARVDLVDVGFRPVPSAGVAVPLFADLKRHDMGDALAETFEGGEMNREFTTARLWGISDTAPYLHDGRATTLYQAIWFHGGEAQHARDNFFDLPVNQQRLVLQFLRSLHTPEHPNENLLPLS